MSTSRLLLLLLASPLGVGAQLTTDFSNNLISDLGPLLALFGENMTKQYLSESTSYSDYLIFSLAPIGILTTLTSVIRVAGSPWLRAFIGRAQEGFGAIEAELMTSNSRDVCELFNNGGITRVLGRPKLLELIFVPGDGLSTNALGDVQHFREYLQKLGDSRAAEWRRKKEKVRTEPRFPPNPNLTLNVGVIKPPKVAFYAIAALGLALQACVLIFAGLGAFTYPSLLGAESASQSNESSKPLIKSSNSAVTFIVGVVVMSVGAFSCAWLIGQSTCEQAYKRKLARDISKNTKLFWLQPGNQLVGDQTFDAFAYIEDESSVVKGYMSSRRAESDESTQFETLTLVAITVTMAGFVAQFIGLRGLGPWTAIAQLAVTLLMTIFRGLLKTRNLKKTDNKFDNCLDLIVGCELDWLAFQFPRQHGSRETRSARDSAKITKVAPQWFVTGMIGASQVTPQHTRSIFPIDEVLHYRTKLAVLTGHNASLYRASTFLNYATWDDDLVRVRKVSRQLANAIASTCQILYGRTNTNHAIRLPVAMVDSTSTVGNVIVEIKCPTTEDLSWTVDSARLEAILGLWLWSFHAKEAAKGSMNGKAGEVSVIAERYPKARIIAAHPNITHTHQKSHEKAQIDLWFGSNQVVVTEDLILLEHHESFNCMTLWRNSGTRLEPIQSGESVKISASTAHNQRISRLFGWNSAVELEIPRQPPVSSTPTLTTSINSHTMPSQPPQTVASSLRISYVNVSGNLLSECAQEIYSIALSQLTRGFETLGDVVPEQSFGQLKLRNPVISALQEMFVQPNIELGSNRDALICILPAFRTHINAYQGPSLLPSLERAAAQAIQNKLWKEAENFMQYACNICEDYHGETGDCRPLRSALTGIGELYRWFFTQQSDPDKRRFGYRGGLWLFEKLTDVTWAKGDETERQSFDAIIHRYIALVIQKAQDNGEEDELPFLKLNTSDPCPWQTESEELSKPSHQFDYTHVDQIIPSVGDEPPTIGQRDLLYTIQKNLRTRCLYNLCSLKGEDLRPTEMHTVLPLAAVNGWDEVVNSLLKLGVPIDSQDNEKKTSLIHFSSMGRDDQVKMLIDHNAKVYYEDEHKNSALLHAAKKGHANVIARLLRTDDVNVRGNLRADFTPLTAAASQGHEAAVALLLDDPRIDFHEGGANGLTPLMAAIKGGSDGVMKNFVRLKGVIGHTADVNDGLRLAAELGGIEVFRAVLSLQGANPFEKNSHQETDSASSAAFGIATRLGHADMVDLVLMATYPNLQDNDLIRACQSSFQSAVHHNHTEVVAMIIKNKMKDINFLSEDYEGVSCEPPLLTACRNSNLELVKMFLDITDVRSSTKGKFCGASVSPLIIAVENACDELAELLLTDGECIVDELVAGKTALRCATETQHESIMRMLLNLGNADPNIPCDDRKTPLHHAIEQGWTAIVMVLLESPRCDINYAGHYDVPLVLAVDENHTDLAIMLIKRADCNINSRSRSGVSVVRKAVKNNLFEVANALMERDCDIDPRWSTDANILMERVEGNFTGASINDAAMDFLLQHKRIRAQLHENAKDFIKDIFLKALDLCGDVHWEFGSAPLQPLIAYSSPRSLLNDRDKAEIFLEVARNGSPGNLRLLLDLDPSFLEAYNKNPPKPLERPLFHVISHAESKEYGDMPWEGRTFPAYSTGRRAMALLELGIFDTETIILTLHEVLSKRRYPDNYDARLVKIARSSVNALGTQLSAKDRRHWLKFLDERVIETVHELKLLSAKTSDQRSTPTASISPQLYSLRQLISWMMINLIITELPMKRGEATVTTVTELGKEKEDDDGKEKTGEEAEEEAEEEVKEEAEDAEWKKRPAKADEKEEDGYDELLKVTVDALECEVFWGCFSEMFDVLVCGLDFGAYARMHEKMFGHQYWYMDS